MTEYWQDLETGAPESSGKLAAEARFGPESLWFSGHFPGHPIVPGVALLHLAAEVVRRGVAEGERTMVESIRRVRFRRPVRPGDGLTLLISPDEAAGGNAYLFRILSGEEMVCTGSIRMRRGRPGEAR